MSFLRRIVPDKFILVLLATVAVATVLPAQGAALTFVGWVSNAAIFLLFFLHGARLSREAVIDGIRRWRLQVAVFAFVYALFPAVGFALVHTLGAVLAPGLLLGLLFLTVLPTTVQSSIAYSSIANGNIAGSVIASAISNLSGVVVAPLLFALLASTAFGQVSLGGIGKIALLLLLPFALGQLLRTWVAPVVLRYKTAAGYMDKLTIVIAVYVAFSESVTGGLWHQVSPAEIGVLTAIVLVLLGAAMAGAWWLGRLLGFERADRVSLLFAGSHKSLATGAPMVRILFPGPAAGAVLLPLLIYHQLQLMVSAVIATRLAGRND